ncbi:MAG: hypothetical protein AAGJ81_08550 [Verrucomicrobiota bacterium]
MIAPRIIGFVTLLSSLSPSLGAQSVDLLNESAVGNGGFVSDGASVNAQISFGGNTVGTVSSVTTGGVQHKPNYIGQLYDITDLALSASPATIDEGETRQLAAEALLDDATTLNVATNDVQWSVFSGPLTGVNATGLASADRVFTDTLAMAQAIYFGLTEQLELTVLNVDTDNFNEYAGDGLADDWQVNFFGLPPNADAAPGANVDNDPYDNETEFLTGYDPTDPNDFFTFAIVDRTGDTNTIELSKIIPGTRYGIEQSIDIGISDPWTSFSSFTTQTEVLDYQVLDKNATETAKFYRVRIEAQ